MKQLLALPLVLLAGAAGALPRHDISKMSCARIDAVLSTEGSAILRYRSQRDPSLTLYDLYVADERFCEMGEVAVLTGVPAASGAMCAVLTCEEFSARYGH